MPDSITPALTPEEWEDEHVEAAAWGADVWLDPNGGFHITGANDLDLTFADRKRHALAALALHGQPFGFTWEDVDALRYMAEREIYADKYGEQGANAEYGHELNRIAGRIAALLPPRQG